MAITTKEFWGKLWYLILENNNTFPLQIYYKDALTLRVFLLSAPWPGFSAGSSLPDQPLNPILFIWLPGHAASPGHIRSDSCFWSHRWSETKVSSTFFNWMCSKSLSSRSSYIGIICPLLGNTPPCVCMLSHFHHAWLCDPMGCNPPDSSVQGSLRERILEWVVMLSFRGSSQSRDQTCIFCISCSAGGLLTHWATWEAQHSTTSLAKTSHMDSTDISRL